MDSRKPTFVKGIGKSEYYLRGNIVELSEEWHKEAIITTMSAETYMNNCIPKLAKMCGKTTFHTYKTPFNEDYHADELDNTPSCDEEKKSKYKSLIASANRVITLGRLT